MYDNSIRILLGVVLNVWGRKVLLCDCDSFTKAYYRSKYEIEKFLPILYHDGSTATSSDEIPPYEGFQIGEELW